MQIQEQIEGIIPSIQSLSVNQMKLTSEILSKELELQNLPEVIRLTKEIQELKKEKLLAEKNESELREQGKEILLNSGMKEFTTLDGTTVALQFTPGSLVIWDNAVIPGEYLREKTSVEIDKTAIKKAMSEGIYFWPEVYIKKDAKLVIKQK